MFVKAQKSLSKARICLCGPAGAGKSYSALQIASGLGSKIAMIDTEHGSGALYSDMHNYDILELHPPFEPKKYIDGIREAENAGYDVIIIDSLTHAWSGEGGLLDMKEKIVQSGKGNDWTAWRYVTPHHNQLVEAILQSKCHIIATARSKMKYAAEEENGKIKRVKKIGLDPILREGMEYEFTVVFDISSEHVATSTKDRTSLFDAQFFTPTHETGAKLLAWLNSNKIPPVLGEKMGTRQRTVIQHDNASFLKSIDEMKDSIGAEIFHTICREYEPLDKLYERNKQIELYKKLKETADFAISIQ